MTVFAQVTEIVDSCQDQYMHEIELSEQAATKTLRELRMIHHNKRWLGILVTSRRKHLQNYNCRVGCLTCPFPGRAGHNNPTEEGQEIIRNHQRLGTVAACKSTEVTRQLLPLTHLQDTALELTTSRPGALVFLHKFLSLCVV